MDWFGWLVLSETVFLSNNWSGSCPSLSTFSLLVNGARDLVNCYSDLFSVAATGMLFADWYTCSLVMNSTTAPVGSWLAYPAPKKNIIKSCIEFDVRNIARQTRTQLKDRKWLNVAHSNLTVSPCSLAAGLILFGRSSRSDQTGGIFYSMADRTPMITVKIQACARPCFYRPRKWWLL
jgi:hypothetical protein